MSDLTWNGQVNQDPPFSDKIWNISVVRDISRYVPHHKAELFHTIRCSVGSWVIRPVSRRSPPLSKGWSQYRRHCSWQISRSYEMPSCQHGPVSTPITVLKMTVLEEKEEEGCDTQDQYGVPNKCSLSMRYYNIEYVELWHFCPGHWSIRRTRPTHLWLRWAHC